MDKPTIQELETLLENEGAKHVRIEPDGSVRVAGRTALQTAYPTSKERYQSDATFNRVADTFVCLMREQGWNYGDFHDAWAIAEMMRHEQDLARLSREGSDA